MLALHSFFSAEADFTLGEDGITVSALFINPNNVVCLAKEYHGELLVLQLSNGVPIYISNFESDEYNNLWQELSKPR